MFERFTEHARHVIELAGRGRSGSATNTSAPSTWGLAKEVRRRGDGAGAFPRGSQALAAGDGGNAQDPAPRRVRGETAAIRACEGSDSVCDRGSQGNALQPRGYRAYPAGPDAAAWRSQPRFWRTSISTSSRCARRSPGWSRRGTSCRVAATQFFNFKPPATFRVRSEVTGF